MARKNKPLDLFSLDKLPSNKKYELEKELEDIKMENKEKLPKKELTIRDEEYSAFNQPKKRPIKMTFDIDYDIAIELKKLCSKKAFGFKKVFANIAIKRELQRLKEEE